MSIFSISYAHKTYKHHLIKILLVLFLTIISLDFYLFGGYQEYLLFFLFSILGIICFQYFDNNNKIISSLFIVLVLNLIVWTKQEGLFYSIIFGTVISLFSYIRIKVCLIFFNFNSIFDFNTF